MGVGIIGLGAMGGAYARNLLAGGISVSGFDPDPSAQEMLSKAAARLRLPMVTGLLSVSS